MNIIRKPPTSWNDSGSTLAALSPNLLLRRDHVEDFLGYKKDHVYGLAEAGELEVHRKEGIRTVMRITRRSVVVHFIATATYFDDGFINELVAVGATFTPALRTLAVQRLERKAD
jgi:hypothetical protein